MTVALTHDLICNYLVARDKRSNHVASDVQRRPKDVRNGTDRDQESYPLR